MYACKPKHSNYATKNKKINKKSIYILPEKHKIIIAFNENSQ